MLLSFKWKSTITTGNAEMINSDSVFRLNFKGWGKERKEYFRFTIDEISEAFYKCVVLKKPHHDELM